MVATFEHVDDNLKSHHLNEIFCSTKYVVLTFDQSVFICPIRNSAQTHCPEANKSELTLDGRDCFPRLLQ